MTDIKLLTPDELAELTGKAWSRHQSAWLVEQGIPHRTDGRRVIVKSDHVLSWLESKDVSKEPPYTPPDWRDYILQPDAQRYDAKKHDGPSVTGIYALYDICGELLYIGKASDTYSRITNHLWAMGRGDQERFSAYSCLEVPSEILNGVEAAHIAALYPPRNFKLETSPCNFREAMTAEIKKIWKVVEVEL
jgi:hypothetical protein